MNLKESRENFLKLQNSIYSKVTLNDVIIDIIEIISIETKDADCSSPHTHTWFEFNYVLSGSMITIFGDNQHTINSGDFFIVPPGTVHSHKYNPKNPHTDICMRWSIKRNPNDFEGNSIYGFLENLKNCHLRPIKDELGIQDIMQKMVREAGEGYYPISLQLFFIKIIALLSEITKNTIFDVNIEKNINAKNTIRKVEVYLNDNILEKIDVHAIAAALHMSYGYLARLYKKYTDKTILDRFTEVRLEKAIKLLEKTDYSIKEIADKSGFSSQYYFSSFFKRKIKISPSEYRKIRRDSLKEVNSNEPSEIDED